MPFGWGFHERAAWCWDRRRPRPLLVLDARKRPRLLLVLGAQASSPATRQPAHRYKY